MSTIALATMGFIGFPLVSDGAPLWPLAIFLLLPFAPTMSAGFDVNAEKKTIRVWNSWGPIKITKARLYRLRLPDIRSGIETNTMSDGREARVRTTRLYWGSWHIRTTLKKPALSELMNEVGALIATAR